MENAVASRTAVVLGATGLVGNELVRSLLHNDNYDAVVTFSRRKLDGDHPKLTQHVVDFNSIDNTQGDVKDIDHWTQKISGSDFFCCIGTTLKTAGSKTAQREIDLELPKKFAKIAANNGIKRCVLISSIGADKPRNSFYLTLKRELESAFRLLSFEQLTIVRPSVLVGQRQEFRLGEILATYLLPILCYIPWFKAYRPIQATQVARAMIELNLTKTQKLYIAENKELLKI